MYQNLKFYNNFVKYSFSLSWRIVEINPGIIKLQSFNPVFAFISNKYGCLFENIQKSIVDINNIIKEIFNNKNDFKPEWNAKNGFEILGADIMFSNKEPFLLEINAKTGLKDCNLIIPGLISTILHDKENEYFTKLL